MLSNGYILILIWVGVIAALAVMAPAIWRESAEGDSAFCRCSGIAVGCMGRV